MVDTPWQVGKRPTCLQGLWGKGEFDTRLPAGDSITLCASSCLGNTAIILHGQGGWGRRVLRMPPLLEADAGGPGNKYTLSSMSAPHRGSSQEAFRGLCTPGPHPPFFSIWSPVGSLLFVLVTALCLSSKRTVSTRTVSWLHSLWRPGHRAWYKAGPQEICAEGMRGFIN